MASAHPARRRHVALPLLATALARSASETAAARPRPVFELGQPAMLIDGVPLRCDIFKESR